MLKVVKFGGSSVAGADQFQKVKNIVLSDPARRVVVVSAAGKRSSDDHKLTDLLYLCHAHLTYGVPCAARLQTFQNMLENETPVTAADVYAKLRSENLEKVYEDIKHVLRKELFYYLPPFKAALMSLGLR